MANTVQNEYKLNKIKIEFKLMAMMKLKKYRIECDQSLTDAN